MTQSNINLEEKEISIKEIANKIKGLWRFLLSKWKHIAISGIIGALIGLTVSFLTKPIYRADLTFVLESSGKSSLGGYGSLAAQFGLNLGDAGGMFQDNDNIIALLQSRSMITRTLFTEIGGELLVDRYLNFSGLRDQWQERVNLKNIDYRSTASSRLKDSVLGIIYKNITKSHLSVGKPDKKLDILSITTSAEDEIFAKAFTENLLNNVTEFYIETQTKKTQENIAILRHQADSVRLLLNAAITGVAVSAEANPNINPAFQRLKVPSQKRMVDVEMNKAILTELVKNLEISEITLRKETPLVQVIDSPVLPLDKKKLGKLKGLVFGFLIGSCVMISFLILRKYFKALLS